MSRFFHRQITVPDHSCQKKLVCAFMRIYGYGSPMFNRFLELYKFRKDIFFTQFLPGFIEWFSGTFLSELCFLLKGNPDQAISLNFAETLSKLICDPDKFGSLFTVYAEKVSDRAWQHQVYPEFGYNFEVLDDSGIPCYD